VKPHESVKKVTTLKVANDDPKKCDDYDEGELQMNRAKGEGLVELAVKATSTLSLSISLSLSHTRTQSDDFRQLFTTTGHQSGVGRTAYTLMDEQTKRIRRG
jgi:hypothetical protein